MKNKEYLYDKIYIGVDNFFPLNIGIIDNNAAIIDDNGKPLCDFIFENIYDDFFNFSKHNHKNKNYCGYDYLVTKKINGKMGVINKHLHQAVNFDYDNISLESNNKFLYAVVEKYGMLLIEPVYRNISDCIYDDIEITYYGDIIVKKDSKYGIIDSYNNVLTDFIYDEIQPSEKTIRLKIGTKYQLQKRETEEDFFNNLK